MRPPMARQNVVGISGNETILNQRTKDLIINNQKNGKEDISFIFVH